MEFKKKTVKPFGKGGAHIVMPISEIGKGATVITNRRKEGLKEGQKCSDGTKKSLKHSEKKISN